MRDVRTPEEVGRADHLDLDGGADLDADVGLRIESKPFGRGASPSVLDDPAPPGPEPHHPGSL